MKNGRISFPARASGPTVAYWLDKHGFTPTIVEAASQLRQEASPSTSVVQARMS